MDPFAYPQQQPNDASTGFFYYRAPAPKTLVLPDGMSLVRLLNGRRVAFVDGRLSGDLLSLVDWSVDKLVTVSHYATTWLTMQTAGGIPVKSPSIGGCDWLVLLCQGTSGKIVFSHGDATWCEREDRMDRTMANAARRFGYRFGPEGQIVALEGNGPALVSWGWFLGFLGGKNEQPPMIG